MCDLASSYVWRDSFVCVTWLIHMCDVTHLYEWHGSFTRVIWLIRVYDKADWNLQKLLICMRVTTDSYVWHDSVTCVHCLVLIYATWLIYLCDVTHSYRSRNSSMCVTWIGIFIYVLHVCMSCVTYMNWLIHTGVYIHIWKGLFIYSTGLFIYVTYGSLMCLTWVIHICDKAGSYIMCDVYKKAYSYRRVYSYMHRHAYMNRPIHICHMWLTHVSDMAHTYVWQDGFIHHVWHIWTGLFI